MKQEGLRTEKSNRGERWQGCVDSLRNKSHSERSEPKWGCQLTEKSERRGPWRQVQGLAWDATDHIPRLQVSWGSLEFRKCVLEGEQEGSEGKAAVVVLRGRACHHQNVLNEREGV